MEKKLNEEDRDLTNKNIEEQIKILAEISRKRLKKLRKNKEKSDLEDR